MSIETSIPRHKINTIAFSAVGFICPLFVVLRASNITPHRKRFAIMPSTLQLLEERLPKT